LLLALVGVGLIAGSASASCYATGYIFYTYSSTSGSYFYVNEPIEGGYAYFYVPAGDTYQGIRSTLDNATAAGRRVAVYGDASSCASSGYRWGGNAVYCVTTPSYY
jgi:hypothetical protein